MPNNDASRRKPGNGEKSSGPAPQRPVTRTRLRILGGLDELIRDQYLLDALRQYKRVQEDLFQQTDETLIENDVYLLCELSRDATIRLTPFSGEMKAVFEYAQKQYQDTLQFLKGKSITESTEKYAANIKKRIDEYTEFLATLSKEKSADPATALLRRSAAD